MPLWACAGLALSLSMSGKLSQRPLELILPGCQEIRFRDGACCCLQRYGWEILPHPAHSPNLAPSDFHLFGPLKRHLGGMAFETEDDLISELRNWFDNLDVDFFRVVSIRPCRAGKNASISTGITLRSMEE
ncbi:transposase [Plakobranchus ocellatus]|uniref:Transposase n=1 Tax=Plakobranchus ocellatus TaxID=259542 RepID=A0AAV3YVH8_9GAST|nr:transposase [Plakobranchus ocellatus]